MNSTILNNLVQKSLKKLTGDWVIIGGTVLPLVGVDSRVTVDIDMIQVHQSSGNQSTLDLMELAESIGLPVESINSAGLFFLKKVTDWEKRLVVHAESKKCRILRPSLDLYFELKLARGTESDLQDLKAYLEWHQDNNLEFNKERTIKLLEVAIKDSESKKMKGLLKLINLI